MSNLNVYIVQKRDPSRTLVLRDSFVRAMRKRFKTLMFNIQKAIVEQDCFGLTAPTVQAALPFYRQFDFPRTADKVQAFMDWVQTQVDEGLLDIRMFPQVANAIESAWTNMFIYDSYKRGVMRARSEMKKKGYSVPTIDASGGIEAVMGAPFHIDAVGVLFTRAFSQLKGITAAMDTQISIVLAQGLIDGDNPTFLARKLFAVINGTGAGDLGITDSLGRFIPAMRRAETLARTEIIRAHHTAMMQEYESWHIEELDLVAEFITAGDLRVCSECEALERGNPYTWKEAQNMVPVHPNCRCVVIPIENPKK